MSVGTDLSRQEDMQALQAQFMEFDPEKKGIIPTSHLGALLKKQGYDLPAKVIANGEAIVDSDGEGNMFFGVFVEIVDFLKRAKAAFDSKANGGKAAITFLGEMLAPVGFVGVDPATTTSLQVKTDPQQTGIFDFSEFVATLFFLRFAINLFTGATGGQGPMNVNQLLEVLPSLNIAGATPDHAKKLFEAHDLDKSGTMEVFEFVHLALALKFPQIDHGKPGNDVHITI